MEQAERQRLDVIKWLKLGQFSVMCEKFIAAQQPRVWKNLRHCAIAPEATKNF
jgi:hypothetical protein